MSDSKAPLRFAVTLFIVLFVSLMAPLGVVQDLRHQVASGGPDSGQHSDSDLCQWVLHHTGHSLTVAVPALPGIVVGSWSGGHALGLLLSAQLIIFRPSRAPPVG